MTHLWRAFDALFDALTRNKKVEYRTAKRETSDLTISGKGAVIDVSRNREKQGSRKKYVAIKMLVGMTAAVSAADIIRTLIAA